MMVPQSRLLYLAAALLIPLSLAVAVEPALWAVAAAIIGAAALLAAVDTVGARSRLDGVEAAFPDVIRLTQDRAGEFDIEIRNQGAALNRLRLGVAFPAALRSPCEEQALAAPGEGGHWRISWPCIGLKRGNYVIQNIYMETGSRLGLWAVRKVAPARAEVRVYPNILPERQHLAGLFLNRGMLGIHAQRQVGRGRELEKLREYLPGDNYEDIHWKATAKRSRPVTKVFQIERTQEIYVVIDTSRLSARPIEEAAPATQLERFITAAMVLGLVAEKQGDLFGLLAFDDQVRRFVRARNGKPHYNACREALYTAQSRRVNPDFGEVFSFIRMRLRRRALLIFLTNLDDPVLAESFVRNVDVLARHHLVFVNMLAAPGVAPLFSDPGVATTDDLYQRLGEHLVWQKLRELQQVLSRRGVSMTLLDSETMCLQLVSQYINVKRRQVL